MMKFISEDKLEKLIAANADCRDLFEPKIFDVKTHAIAEIALEEVTVETVALNAA